MVEYIRRSRSSFSFNKYVSSPVTTLLLTFLGTEVSSVMLVLISLDNVDISYSTINLTL